MSDSRATDPGDPLTEERLRTVDSDGMYDRIRGFPDQWRRARTRAREIALDVADGAVDHVLLVGMGGSALAGDLLAALVRESSAVPVTVSRTYDLPGFVDERTLVIGSSYSGNTEETLSGFQEAIARDAHCYAVTSNGHLRGLCENEGIGFHALPDGFAPRAALGYSLAAVLAVAAEAGVFTLSGEAWNESVAVLDEMSDRLSDVSGNEALDVARRLRNRLPLVYSGSTLIEPVNTRWRCQLQENAETLAYGNAFPELNHNEIMGWADTEWLRSQLGVVVLRDASDHPRVRHRMEITRELLEERAGFWAELESEGTHPLTRMLSLVHLGDWVSLYLAVLEGIDPTAVALIDGLKERLG